MAERDAEAPPLYEKEPMGGAAGGMAAPPSYNSVYGKLKSQKSQADGPAGYAKGVANVYSSSFGGLYGAIILWLFLLILGFALPITEITIGSLYLNQCDAQYLLPIFLIVSGVFAIVGGFCKGGDKMRNRNKTAEEENNKGGNCCGGLISTFLLVWFICGSIWIYRMKECEKNGIQITNSTTNCFTTNPAYSERSFYCQELLYWFTYYDILVKWIVSAIIMCIGVFACCCACCIFCCSGL